MRLLHRLPLPRAVPALILLALAFSACGSASTEAGQPASTAASPSTIEETSTTATPTTTPPTTAASTTQREASTTEAEEAPAAVEHYWQTCGFAPDEMPTRSDDFKDAVCALFQSFPADALADPTVQSFVAMTAEQYDDGFLDRATIREMVIMVPGNDPDVVNGVAFYDEK